jgi:hypothetical protein
MTQFQRDHNGLVRKVVIYDRFIGGAEPTPVRSKGQLLTNRERVTSYDISHGNWLNAVTRDRLVPSTEGGPSEKNFKWLDWH